jgi:AmiR/NasT family two-component response regulator
VDHGPCVVILSAYGDSDFRKRAKEIGVCGYLTKPITSDTLVPELERIYCDYCANRDS